MTSQAAFNAAKNAYSMCGAFFSTVAQQTGTERALALYAKYDETYGVKLADMLKKQRDEKEHTLKRLVRSERKT